jgi:hypothetical protein
MARRAGGMGWSEHSTCSAAPPAAARVFPDLYNLTESERRGRWAGESNSGGDSRTSTEAEMGLADDGGSRFDAYVEGLVSVIGHKDREGRLRDYCTGLMMPCERKSVEPMAAVTAPARVAAQHQSLLHFIGLGGWSDERILAKGARWFCRRSSGTARSRHGSLMTRVSPNQGRHSVGVARQYSGQRC